jgi:hypothetical protein
VATYTIDQVHSALAKAKAAGDAGAMQRLGQYAVQLAMKNAPKDEYNAADEMSTFAKLRAGVGQGMTNVVRHAGNLVGAESDEDLANAKGLDKSLMNTTPGKIGGMIGETAITAPLMAGAGGVAARLGGGVAAQVLANPIARGVAEGAAQGALMGDPGERGMGALVGGATGGVLPALAAGGSKVVRGLSRTPEAQALLDRGVDLTPGQMNPHGIANHLEQTAESLPLVSGMVKGARANGERTFQQAVVREGAAPGAHLAPGNVHEMLDTAYRSFEPLYDQAKGFPMKPVVMNARGPDIPLPALMQAAVGSKGTMANTATRRKVGAWLQNELTAFDGTSDSLLKIRSNIRSAARDATSGAATMEDKATADLLGNAEGAITSSLESQLPKGALATLRSADSKYGQYKTVEAAVAAAKDSPNGFSPHQLSTAVKSGMSQGAYARGGGGSLRDMAAQGREVFQQVTPPTGARLATIAPMAVAAVHSPLTMVPALGGALALSTTKTGRRIAAGATAPQKAMAALSDKSIGQLSKQDREALAQVLRRLSVSSGQQLLIGDE